MPARAVLVLQRPVAAFLLLAPIGCGDRLAPIILGVGEMPGEHESDAFSFTGLQSKVRRQRGVLRGFVFGCRTGRARKPAASQEIIPPFLKLIKPLAVLPC